MFKFCIKKALIKIRAFFVMYLGCTDYLGDFLFPFPFDLAPTLDIAHLNPM